MPIFLSFLNDVIALSPTLREGGGVASGGFSARGPTRAHVTPRGSRGGDGGREEPA